MTSYYQFIYLNLFYFLYFLQGFSSCIIILVSNKICFNNIIPKSNSAEYSSIYYACVGLFGGLSPFIIGQIFDMLINPYEVIFLYSFIFFISASYFFFKLNYESRQDYQGNPIDDNIFSEDLLISFHLTLEKLLPSICPIKIFSATER